MKGGVDGAGWSEGEQVEAPTWQGRKCIPNECRILQSLTVIDKFKQVE